jgi:hypothetical protein
VAAAECYLLEWVRDDVLKHDYRELQKYFPDGAFRPVKDKWKDIPKDLRIDGRIAGALDCNTEMWRQFGILVGFRNGLVHGGASRPHLSSEPMPPFGDLATKQPGWAVGVVRELITSLHQVVGTAPPAWLA